MKSTTYLKTGNVKSRRKDVERGILKDMSSTTILVEGGRVIYQRWATEVWAFAFFGSWAVYIYFQI